MAALTMVKGVQNGVPLYLNFVACFILGKAQHKQTKVQIKVRGNQVRFDQGEEVLRCAVPFQVRYYYYLS